MLERVNDLITYRIDAVLDEITRMSLCDLPDDEPITPEEFLQHTQVN
jgi:dynein heavy chain